MPTYLSLLVTVRNWQSRHPEIDVTCGPLQPGIQGYNYFQIQMARAGSPSQTFRFDWAPGSDLHPRLLRMLNYRNRRWALYDDLAPKNLSLTAAIKVVREWAASREVQYAVYRLQGLPGIQVTLTRNGYTSPSFELSWKTTAIRKEIHARIHTALETALAQMSERPDVWALLEET